MFNNYVHAVDEVGYFGFENLPSQMIGVSKNDFILELMIPGYNSEIKSNDDNSHAGEGLQTLGYRKGIITKTANSIRYHQQTWKENYYEVLVQWKKNTSKNVIGSWTISVNEKAIAAPVKSCA